MLPSRRLSDKLIAYDEVWNSWVHYALEYPDFQQQCMQFMNSLEDGVLLETVDPFWLAVYFSVLCVSFVALWPPPCS